MLDLAAVAPQGGFRTVAFGSLHLHCRGSQYYILKKFWTSWKGFTHSLLIFEVTDDVKFGEAESLVYLVGHNVQTKENPRSFVRSRASGSTSRQSF